MEAIGKAKVLIVDGYSIIFQWPQLRALQHRRKKDAREKLITLLTHYQDSCESAVILVFDGQGNRATEHSPPNGIRVFYSATHQTADALIERLVAKYAAQFWITVATDDHLERQTVETFGAEWISSEQLALELQQKKQELEEYL